MPRRTALLRLYYFVFFSALGAYVPYFPTWLRARGVTGIAMSAVMVVNPILGVVSPLLFGLVADRFGLRGSLLRLATFGAFASMSVVAALEISGHHPSLGVLFGLIAVFAFFRGPMVSMADVAALEDPTSYGKTRLFGSFGFLVMAVSFGRFFDATEKAAIPLAVAAPLLVTLPVTFRLPARAAGRPEPISEEAARLVRSPDYVLFLVAGALWFAAHVAYDLCFSMHLKDIGASPSYVGTSWAVGVMAEMALMRQAQALFDRWGTVRMLAVGLVAGAVRFSLIARVHSLDVLFLLQPLHAVTFALVWTAGLEHVKRRAPARILATAQSLFSVATALGSAAGMLVWGPLYARSGGTAVFSGAAAVSAAGAAVALALGYTAAPSVGANAS